MNERPWIGSLAGAQAATGSDGDAPAAGAALRAAGHAAVLLLDAAEGRRAHWLDTPQARGWVVPAPGQGVPAAEAVASAYAQARAAGHVAADALLIAGLQAAGIASPAPGDLPQLSWGEALAVWPLPSSATAPLDLYAIVDSVERLRPVVDAGIATVQLRIKRPAAPDAAWQAWLRQQLAQALQACRAAGATLVVNDHWELARALGAPAVHLGQDDLLALGEAGRAGLVASGVGLGISSHSLWELCRARALAPRSIACGPVWPTTTKDMPWKPQGLDNLAWWVRHAGAPVTAIGGILNPVQVRQAASCGADGVCVVRGLGERPAEVLPALREALQAGRADPRHPAPGWLHPVLPV
jgi:thiamine-phosphate diphosphorylase